jgi:hypothetical protein
MRPDKAQATCDTYYLHISPLQFEMIGGGFGMYDNRLGNGDYEASLITGFLASSHNLFLEIPS